MGRGCWPVWPGRCDWLAEKVPAEIDPSATVAVGKEAEVAHAVEPIGEHVKKKAPDEFVGSQTHDLLALMPMVTIVFPSEGDMIVVDVNDTAVGDGDPMGVATEIGEHLVGPAERRLAIDDPIDAACPGQMAIEYGRVVKVSEFIEEVQLALCESFVECCQKEPTEQARQHTDRQKETRPACDPSGFIRGDAATRHHAMNVGMMGHRLSPGMQDGGDPDLGAEPFGLLAIVCSVSAGSRISSA